MSLKAWYKLNGNVTNYGTGDLDLTLVTNPSWAVGKVADQALCQGAYNWTAAQTASIMNNEEFSYAAWIYVTATDSDNMIFGNNSERLFALFQYPSRNDLHWSWKYNDAGTVTGGVREGVLPDNTWTHIAFSYKKGNAKFYINGAQVASESITYSRSNFNVATNVIHNKSGRRLQDVRIYDHAISAKEVHDIAMGLMMHVQFYDRYTGVSPNLVPSAWYDMTQRTIGQYYDILSNSTSHYGLTTGDTLIYRIKITAPSDRGLIARLQFYNSDSDRYSVTGNTIAAGTTGYSTIKRTITSGDHSYARMDLMVTNANSGSATTSVSYQVGEIKLERGTHSTPWTPYSSVKGDGICDCSGFDRTLTVTDHSPTLVAEGPAGSGTSAQFKSNEYIEYTLPTGMTTATWMTWIKIDSRNGAYASVDISKGNPTGNLWLSVNTENVGLWAYCGGIYNSKRSLMFSPDEWHHIAMTWKNGISQWYCDGEIQGSSVDFSSKRTEWPSGTRSIGDSYAGASWSGAPFYGSLADWRLYATVLSADDIKKIAKSPIAVDKTGKLYTLGCFSELVSDQPMFGRDGTVGTTYFSEILGRYNSGIRIEPDGSAWVKIVHHADPTTYLFASGDPFTTGVYKDDRRWFAGHLCANVDKWEFILEQKPDASTAKQTYRWVQTVDPNSATYASVAAASVTKYGSSQGYTDSSSNYGGIYKFNSNAYYVCNNGSSGNWFCALGAWNNWSDGIPGYNGVAIKDGGYMDLYLRVDNVTFTNSNITSMYVDKGGNGVFTDKLIEN